MSDDGDHTFYLTPEQSTRMRLGEHRGHSACGNTVQFYSVPFTGGIISCGLHGELSWEDTFPRRDPLPIDPGSSVARYFR